MTEIEQMQTTLSELKKDAEEKQAAAAKALALVRSFEDVIGFYNSHAETEKKQETIFSIAPSTNEESSISLVRQTIIDILQEASPRFLPAKLVLEKIENLVANGSINWDVQPAYRSQKVYKLMRSLHKSGVVHSKKEGARGAVAYQFIPKKLDRV